MTRLSPEKFRHQIAKQVDARYETTRTGGPKKYYNRRRRLKLGAKPATVALPELQANWFRELCRALTRFRHEAGLTQQQLSALTRTSQRYISQLENGRLNPTADSLERIFQALDLVVNLTVNPKRGQGSDDSRK